MPVSLSRLASDLAADGAAIWLDLSGGGYDRLFNFLENWGLVPKTPAGRRTLVAAILLVSRIADQKLDTSSPVKNFIHEVTGDAMREEAKRILESGRPDARVVDALKTIARRYVGMNTLEQAAAKDQLMGALNSGATPETLAKLITSLFIEKK